MPRRAIILGVSVWALLGLAWLFAPEHPVHAAAAVLRDLGPAGAVLFAVGWAAAALLLLPAWPFSLIAGLVWGPVIGVAVASPSSVFAALVVFGLARTGLRDVAVGRFGGDPRVRALDAAIASRGLPLVLLLRLSPLFPFNFLNYALALTGLSGRSYAVGTAVGMLPFTAASVYVGALAGGGDAPRPVQWALAAVGVAATLGVARLASRIVAEALSAVDDDPARPPGAPQPGTS